MTDNQLVELIDIEANYSEEPILSQVNLVISKNDFIGVIGPNGGGKTTLLKVILGLLTPVKGKVVLNGDTENLFGYLPQKSEFDRNFPITVREVVLSGLFSSRKLFSFGRNKEKQKVEEILSKYNLLHYADQQISELSGGELQRVLLCRAIVSRPKLLILDEPTTYVDSTFETEFYSLIQELNKEMAIVMVSHDLGTICSYVKTIACVNRNLHFHNSNKINNEQLKAYNCPLELVTHGPVPHRVLSNHNKES